jgi:hypothetical protein
MSHSIRFFRRSVVGLLGMLCGVCAGQGQVGAPGRIGVYAITGLVGAKATAEEATRRVGFAGSSGSQIEFGGASKVVGALGDFDGDGLMDYAFAFSPVGPGGSDLCIYFGDGAGGFSGGNAYPPVGGKSGCGAFSVLGSSAPEFAYVAAVAFRTGELPGLIVEDSANGNIYVLGVAGAGVAGGLPGLAVRSTIATAAADGAGPIYTGDFNGDGKTDFIVNGQDGHSASVYFGNGDGTFQTPVRYAFDHGVRWLQLGDMDRDGHADMVVEGEDGGVEVFHGNADGSFATVSEGRIELPNGGAVGGALLLADFDGDGYGDIAAIASAGGVNELYVWYGRCDGTFGEAQIVPLGHGYSLAVVADVNGDGLPDVVLSDGAVVSVLDNLGKRNFGTDQQVFAGAGVTSLAVEDVNHDGAPDLVVSSEVANTGGIAVLLNTARAKAKPAVGSPTTSTLYLCVGPTPTCPSTGYVMPPQVSTLIMTYGQTYNGTAVVTDTDATELSGDILFDDDYNGTTMLLCTLVADVASSCPPTVGTGAQVGTHVLTASYLPGEDTVHAPSTSSPVTLTVSPDTTTATVVGSPSTSPQGRPVTLMATVMGSEASSVTFVGLYAPPSGMVTFLNGTTVIGTGTLVASGGGVSSTATLTTSALPVGTDSITATYAGDMDFSGTVSPVFTETITPVVATTTTLTSSVNPSYFGQSVTFTATVALVGGASAPVATGTVTFLDNGTAIGTGTLNGAGVATFTTSTLAVGRHNMTASASGDVLTGPSSSAVLVQVVDPLPPPGSVNFNVTVTPNPVSVGVGTGAQLAVTVTQLTSFSTAVNLSCSGLPTEASCQFVNAAIASGGGSTTLVLGTMAPHSCGSATPYFVGSNGGGAGIAVPVLAGLAAVFVPGRRRWLRGLIALAAVAAAMQLSGCGNCTDLGTRPGTYTVQVVGTATGSGTSEVEGAIVTLTVTI